MKTTIASLGGAAALNARPAQQRAFTLVEILVAIAIMAIAFVSLYVGITTGVQVIKLARENLRATQIIVEKMETIRIKSWSELTNGVGVPTHFSDTFYPPMVGCQGITYHGVVTVTQPILRTNYDADLRQVTVTLRWTNSSIVRVREMTTYVARTGIQNYVF